MYVGTVENNHVEYQYIELSIHSETEIGLGSRVGSVRTGVYISAGERGSGFKPGPVRRGIYFFFCLYCL